MTEKELLNLKKEIDSTKIEISELTGEEKALTKRLKDDWECNTLAQAKIKIREFEKELSSLDELIANESEVLENEINIIKKGV